MIISFLTDNPNSWILNYLNLFKVSLHFLDMDTYVNPIKKLFLKPKSATYFENSFELKNCRVENENFLKNDFLEIGFTDIEVITSNDFFSKQKAYYVKAKKKKK